MDSLVKFFQELSSNLKIAVVGFLFTIPFVALSLYYFAPTYCEESPIYIQLLIVFCLSVLFYVASFCGCFFMCVMCGSVIKEIHNIVTPLFTIVLISIAITINRYFPFKIDFFIAGYFLICALTLIIFINKNNKQDKIQNDR